MTVMFQAVDEVRLVREFFSESHGFFVEVGANAPRIGSQTFPLEEAGWDGILIEPLPELANAIRASRRAKLFAVACSAPENSGKSMPLQVAGIFSSLNPQLSNAKATPSGVIDVPVRTLDEILLEARAPAPIDFLSVDVEGHEIEVMRGFDFQRWRPRLILIEDLVLDRRLHRFLLSHGYAWMRRTVINSWYVPAPLPFDLDLFDRWQFFRKYYLGVPARQLRQVTRRLRRQFGTIYRP